MRPKDPYLRKAACALWAGECPSDSAAWSLPGPVQTVYRAEQFSLSSWHLRFSGGIWKSFPIAKGWSMRRSVSGLAARPALLPGTPTSGPGIETSWARWVFAGCASGGSHPTGRRGRTAFPLATEPGTTTRTGWPAPRQSALGHGEPGEAL